MKSKTLYVSDLDGTLLNTKSLLSEYTTNRLNAIIKEHGAMFTIATARTPATVSTLMRQVDSNLPYIVMTGAAMWDARTYQYTDVRHLGRESLAQIIDVFDRHHVNPFIYCLHDSQIVVYHADTLSESERGFIMPRVQGPLKHLQTCTSLSSLAGETDKAVLVFSMGRYHDMEAINAELLDRGTACQPACYYDIMTPDQGILDIYAPGTTKALAIRRLADRTGADRVVVFGDNRNDIPMMHIADRSVAVANAYDEVKAQADEVSPYNNEEDAVVKWIEQDLAQST